MAATALASGPNVAYAQDQRQQRFDIAPGPLGAAINAYVRQTGEQLLVADEIVANRRSPGVRGTHDPREALEILLRGSGLEAERSQRGVIYLKEALRKRPVSHNQIAPVAVSTAAPVAPATEDDEGAMAEIIVTAQKREERLQDTPIAITVLSSDDLEDRGISSLADLFEGAVPSVRVTTTVGRPSALTIGMRGIVPTNASQISIDPTVGIYLDGVYLGRIQGLGTELADIQRIEVLRGPQGTLFGRNAVGGALSIVTKRPAGELRFSGKAGFGNRNGRTLAAHLDLPEFADISVKLDAAYVARAGTVKNPLAGASDWGAIKRYGLRASALWEPVDDISVLYAFDVSRDKSTATYGHIASRLGPSAPPLPPLFAIEDGRVQIGRLGVPMDPSSGKVSGHHINVEWQMAQDITLRSITAWREIDQDQWSNDAGATSLFSPGGSASRNSFARVHQTQFSQEIQLVGSHADLKYVLGAYYFKESAEDEATAFVTNIWNADGSGTIVLDAPRTSNPPPGSNATPDRASIAKARSQAIFGQLTWSPSALDGRFHLTGGLRYTDDRKHGELTSQRASTPNPPRTYLFESKRVDPAIIIAYDFSENAHGYAKWGSAYRSGGADSRSPTFRTFGEEVLSAWEIGLKTELFDRRARINVAAYVNRLKNPQVTFQNFAVQGVTEILNGDKAEKVKGLEVEAAYAPSRRLQLDVSYAYTDAELPPQVNPFSGNLVYTVVTQTPKHAATAGIDYELPSFSFGTLDLNLDADWSSSTYASPSDTTASRDPLILNARLTLKDITDLPEGLEVSVWGKNLTNALRDAADTPVPTVGNNLVWYNEPRTYGLDVRFSF